MPSVQYMCLNHNMYQELKSHLTTLKEACKWQDWGDDVSANLLLGSKLYVIM